MTSLHLIFHYIIVLRHIRFINFNKVIIEIKHESIENDGRFYIQEESMNVSQLDYQLLDKNTLQIMHTGVSKEVEGQGVGKLLVLKAISYARKISLMIKPIYSFTKVVLDRSAEFADVYIAEKDNNA